MPSHQPANHELQGGHTPDTVEAHDRVHGFALYGLWATAGWIAKKIHPQASGPNPETAADTVSGATTHAIPETPAPMTSPASHAPPATDNAKPAIDGAGLEAPGTAPDASAPRTAQPATIADTGAGAPGAPGNNAITNGVAPAPSGSIADHVPVVGSGGGGAARRPSGADDPLESYLAKLGDVAEFQLFDDFIVPWPETFESLAGTQIDQYLTLVAGDYFDVQLAVGDGSPGWPNPAVDGFEFSFGSVLQSTASDYDLVVIEQDLVEINAILQLNAGSLGDFAIAGSADDMQGNLATIVDHIDPTALQVTIGDMIDAAAIQQINYLAQAGFGSQFNHAAILDDITGNERQDVASAWSADTGLSTLYVTGTYYEINLVYQLSEWASSDGGHSQLNSALINDYDGIGKYQIVGGDQYDLDAILQINHFSQSDQLAQLAPSDFLPGALADAIAWFSGDPIGHGAGGGALTETPANGLPVFQLADLGLSSGGVMGDLMSV